MLPIPIYKPHPAPTIVTMSSPLSPTSSRLSPLPQLLLLLLSLTTLLLPTLTAASPLPPFLPASAIHPTEDVRLTPPPPLPPPSPLTLITTTHPTNRPPLYQKWLPHCNAPLPPRMQPDNITPNYILTATLDMHATLQETPRIDSLTAFCTSSRGLECRCYIHPGPEDAWLLCLNYLHIRFPAKTVCYAHCGC